PLAFINRLRGAIGVFEVGLLLPEVSEVRLAPCPGVVEERNLDRRVEALQRFGQWFELALGDVGTVRVEHQKLQTGILRVEQPGAPEADLGWVVRSALAGFRAE